MNVLSLGYAIWMVISWGCLRDPADDERVFFGVDESLPFLAVLQLISSDTGLLGFQERNGSIRVDVQL